MAKIDEEFPLTEWLIWVIHQADGEWLPAHPLQSLADAGSKETNGDNDSMMTMMEFDNDDLPSFATYSYDFERGYGDKNNSIV